MSQLSNKLTAKAVKNLSYNAKGKNKYADGGGLYLLITANGAKHWRMDYRRPVTQKKYACFRFISTYYFRDGKGAA